MSRLGDLIFVNQGIVRLFLAVIILVAMIGGGVWWFFFDQGVVVFESEGNFLVNLNGDNFECENSCERTLDSGNYVAQLKKEGFEDLEQVFVIERGEKVEVVANFVFIPKVTQEIALDQAFEEMLDFELKGVSLFDFEKWPQIEERTFKAEAVEWLPKSEQFVVLFRESGSLQQALFLTDKFLDEREQIVVFPRTIERLIISVSKDESKLMMADLGDEKSEIYLVDLEKKSRERIETLENVVNLRWLDDKYVLWGRVENGQILNEAFDVEKREIVSLDFDFERGNLVESAGRYFMVEGKVGLAGKKLSELEVWELDLSQQLVMKKSFAKIGGLDLEQPKKIDLSADLKKLRVVSDGRIWEFELKN